MTTNTFDYKPCVSIEKILLTLQLVIQKQICILLTIFIKAICHDKKIVYDLVTIISIQDFREI